MGSPHREESGRPSAPLSAAPTVWIVSHNDEVHAFLSTRRARIRPEEVGIATAGSDRRVAGLRRGEVAARAGISLDYYKQLERGELRGASEAVLEMLCRALRLDEAERSHLLNLATTSNRTTRGRSSPVSHAHLARGVHGLLAHLTVPTLVYNEILDLLDANRPGEALFSEFFRGDPRTPPNLARRLFLHPDARPFWIDWESSARSTAAILRRQLACHPADGALRALVADLAAGSEDFRRIWALDDVHWHRDGRKRFRHPAVGEIELAFQTMRIEGADGNLVVVALSATDPASESALGRLTPDPPPPTPDVGGGG